MEQGQDYGRTSLTPFAVYDPDSCSLKMSLGYCLWEGIESSVILHPSGMMRNGKLYQRVPLVPRTRDTGLPLWDTPNVIDSQFIKTSLKQMQKWHKAQGQIHFAGQYLLETGEKPSPEIYEGLMGFPQKMDCQRIKQMGNAVVPQWAEWIGRQIVEFDNG